MSRGGFPEKGSVFTEADSEKHGKVLCVQGVRSSGHTFIDGTGRVFTCCLFGPTGNKVVGLESQVTGLTQLVVLAQEMRRRGAPNPCSEELLLETESWK